MSQAYILSAARTPIGTTSAGKPAIGTRYRRGAASSARAVPAATTSSAARVSAGRNTGTTPVWRAPLAAAMVGLGTFAVG